MKNTNEMEIRFESRSANEGFARVAVASFLTQLNPTVEEVADVKTAVSEAVTNAIIHGYENEIHKVYIRCRIEDNVFTVEVCDKGRGLKMWRRLCSLCIRQSRNRTVPVWDLLLWKPLWTVWR